MSYSRCPFLAVLNVLAILLWCPCSSCPILTILFLLLCPRSIFFLCHGFLSGPAALSRLHPICPARTILPLLFCRKCPVISVMFCLYFLFILSLKSCPCCPSSCPGSPVPSFFYRLSWTWLSSSCFTCFKLFFTLFVFCGPEAFIIFISSGAPKRTAYSEAPSQVAAYLKIGSSL